ncbi:MAG: SGNH/GDSL hydrolase family protein [Bacteroidales bacterium]|nr:SGNH/GDSL hydrolase family protein [Bacteroidales bacterium]
MKQGNLAVFSLASGGDRAANMIASGTYQKEYLQLKPDVFIMSGGGNDLLENERILNLISDEPIDKTSPFLKDYGESIIMAMIFDFNEILIELGKEYPNIYHVDVRGFNHFLETNRNKRKGRYWYDELHPTKKVFAEIAKTYVAIINGELPKNKRIFSVIDYFRENGKQAPL